jgi:hypothetical protein
MGGFNTISDVVSRAFVSGRITYDLMKDGAGLAPIHETEASLPSCARIQLDWVNRAIIEGSIDQLDSNSHSLVKHQLCLSIPQR